MKVHAVLFDPHAQEEASDAAEYVARQSPVNDAKWYTGLAAAIDSLRTMPSRCGRVRESKQLGVDLRHYFHHSHRVIFRIEEDAGIVRVPHVRHDACDAIGEANEEEEIL